MDIAERLTDSVPHPASPHGMYSPRIRAFLHFVIAAIFVFAANWFAGGIAFSLMGEHALRADFLFRLLGCGLLIGGFSLMLRLLDENDAPLPEALTLPLNLRAAKHVLLGIGLGAVLTTLDVAVMIALGSASVHSDLTLYALLKAFLVALLLMLGALLEELSFRGYPFQRLLDSVGPLWAIFILSCLFAGVHLDNPGNGGLLSWSFLNTVAVGVLLAVAFLRTGNLWLPVGIHFGWNYFLGVVYGLPVSGLRQFNVIVRTNVRGPHALTGGAYGPEGSATCAAVMLIGLPVVVSATRRRALAQASTPSIPQ